jgi:5-methylthioadenosine/S-adenosylhomocysteine deaminase
MGKLIIRNCEVMTFEGQVPRFVPGQDILIEGNKITGIQPTAALAQSDCQIIDATGMLAVPGMVNTHAHVPMVLFRNAGPDVNEERLVQQGYLSARSQPDPRRRLLGGYVGDG